VTGYTVCVLALVVGGLAPGLWITARGSAVDRLVGLELVSVVSVVIMLVLAQVTGQSYYLAVPLVLAPLSVTGTLVFTRLLGRRDGSS
jgi:multisubunit Na+/H+ antiporter MnhF subunit